MSVNLNLDDLMKKVSNARATMAARSGQNNVAKPPAGKSRWRILPGWRTNDRGTFYHAFGQHWIKDENKQILAVVVCERETFGNDCECCNHIQEVATQLKRQGLDKEHPKVKQLNDMRGKFTALVNAVRRDGDNKSDKPVLLGLGTTTFNKYLGTLQTRMDEGINILDLKEGKDIIIDRTGSLFNTEYDLVDAGATSAVNPEVMNELIDIDAYIAAERSKGLSKANMILGPLKTLLGANVGRATLLPPASSLVPNVSTVGGSASALPFVPNDTESKKVSRVIDNEEEPVAQKATTSLVNSKETTMSSELLADEELAAMLEALN